MSHNNDFMMVYACPTPEVKFDKGGATINNIPDIQFVPEDPIDQELKVMKEIFNLLQPLDVETRQSVLNWVFERLRVNDLR